MDQTTHTWMAIRASALLEELRLAPGLVGILKPKIKSVAIGSWIPDLRDSKIGSGDIDNHIFKIKPLNDNSKDRFILKKDKLIKKLGYRRLMGRYLKKDTNLDDNWWNSPYKADPTPGQHLANRTIALATTIIDLLILGDSATSDLVPGNISFADKVDPNARTKMEQAATYFFMLSHFIADSCMPCHCDARKLMGYKKGLHKELEKHWSKRIGKFFEKNKLDIYTGSTDNILSESRQVDKEFRISFPKSIPKIINYDIWEEIVIICRASFAIACILVPPSKYPFGTRKMTSFKKIFESDRYGKNLLKKIDRIILHDAILNIAIIWLHIWKRFKPR